MIVKPLIDDHELLAGIARRDEHAFAIVYERFRTVSLRYLKSAQHAEDSVQEVFLKLWRMEEQLYPIRNIEAYLLQLTKHKCLNMLRRLQLEQAHMEPMSEDHDLAGENIEDRLLLKETRKILNDAIALLPPQQKQVYQLCQLDGLKYAEVAEKLHLAPETVRSHLKLATRFLRQHLGKHKDLVAILIIFKLF